MGFRVTEARVEFHHARLAVLDHQADIEDAAVRAAFAGHPGDGRLDDRLDDLVVQHGRYHGRGRICPHTTRVRAFIVVECAFVVLRGGERQNIPAVGEGKEGGFFTIHEFLDDHAGTGGTKDLVEHDIVNRRNRLIFGHGDDDTLACSQTVRLDHDRGALGLDVVNRCIPVGKGFIGSRRDVVLFHQVLGEALAALDAGRQLVGTKDLQINRLKAVDNAERQRDFRTDNRQVDFFGLGKVNQRFDIIGRDMHAISKARYPRVTGCTVDCFHQGRLRELPDQRMLTTTTTDNQNFHHSLLNQNSLKTFNAKTLSRREF